MDLALAEYLQERSQKDPEQEWPYLLMGSKGGQLDSACIKNN